MPTTTAPFTPAGLREARAKRRSARPRDLAESLGVPEAALVAAQIGRDVVRLDPRPDRLLARLPALGAVMGLTRNDACVIEHSGRYGTYRQDQITGADIRL
ncbi:MAG: ChuX/HutX family heme-like substrate-binding protein, partial [Pseudomonadota bacterium]